MKICIAQTKAIKGKVRENIQNHLQIINQAIELKADLVVFPELSITGYEPILAKDFVTEITNPIFNPFQEIADKNKLTIGIGMPTNLDNGIGISMLIFHPNKKRTVYSKQHLHDDELPYFVCGKKQTYLTIQGIKIALGICYESLQRKHFVDAIQNGATVYIASVAKSEEGVEKANQHFGKIAMEFNTPVLLTNSVGYCDNFMSAGQSTVWNHQGIVINRLDDKNQGLLVYDTKSKTTEVHQPTISKGQLSELEEVFQIYRNAKNKLDQDGLHQWTDNYPTKKHIENDLLKGVLFVLKNNRKIIGAINISEEQEKEYQAVDWQFNSSKVLVIHRLVIDPIHQRKGHAQSLMDFGESFGVENNYSSIRLDAYSQNERVLAFYNQRDYVIRGQVYFPKRVFAFHCMEKEIKRAK